MSDNIVQFPTAYEPYEAQPQPVSVRVVLTPPPAPFLTPLGVLVAVLAGVVTFVAVSALIG
ncbi:hypothetical protein [uncultured Shimia sp.]|uniref:hypothetical protein n=1 Tax=uncultured Shimia sp. TaxID=573152 RepID=UPI00261D1D7D|nr:hypothetical protein [uncultured Shimia sp.]